MFVGPEIAGFNATTLADKNFKTLDQEMLWISCSRSGNLQLEKSQPMIKGLYIDVSLSPMP